MNLNSDSFEAAPKVLIVANVWPEPDSSAAGKHMVQLLETLSAFAGKILFACTAAESPFMSPRVAALCATTTIRVNCSSFDRLVADFSPDLVLFDRFMTEEQFGWRVREAAPEAVTVLNTEDLHFIRRWRETLRNKTDYSFTDISLQAFHTADACRELAAVYRCDLTLIISHAELSVLHEKLPSTAILTHYHPLCASMDANPLNNATDYQHNVISLGNFFHKPNQDAALTLIQDIWPGLRTHLKGAALHLFGAYATEKHLGWSQPHNDIWVKGRVYDLENTLYSHRLLLAPIRFGAGLKGKLLDAMCHGLPFVTTPIGIEGIDSPENCEAFIGFSRDDFIRKSVRLYHDTSLRAAYRHWASEILRDRFDAQQQHSLLLSRLTELLQNRAEIRLQNITGSIMRHHSLASTRYMGKWIEAKNAGKP